MWLFLTLSYAYIIALSYAYLPSDTGERNKERKKERKNEGGEKENSSNLCQRVNDLLITCFSACLSACSSSVRDVTSRLRAWHTRMSGGPADSRRYPHQFVFFP